MTNKHSKPALTRQSVCSPFDLVRQFIDLIFKETIHLLLSLNATPQLGATVAYIFNGKSRRLLRHQVEPNRSPSAPRMEVF